MGTGLRISRTAAEESELQARRDLERDQKMCGGGVRVGFYKGDKCMVVGDGDAANRREGSKAGGAKSCVRDMHSASRLGVRYMDVLSALRDSERYSEALILFKKRNLVDIYIYGVSLCEPVLFAHIQSSKILQSSRNFTTTSLRSRYDVSHSPPIRLKKKKPIQLFSIFVLNQSCDTQYIH